MSLQLSSTEGLRNLLKAALKSSSSNDTDNTKAWRDYSGSSDGDPVPYSTVRAAIHEHARQSTAIEGAIESFKGTRDASKSAGDSSEASRVMSRGGSDAVIGWLAGCEVILPVPPPRVKSPELEARLQQLREAEERRTYRDLVKDVARHGGGQLSGRGGEGGKGDGPTPFSSFRQQLGFGMHVLAIMFTGYVAGHYLFARLFPHQQYMHPVGGITGLIGGMLVETILFVIQMSRVEAKEERQRVKEERRKRAYSSEEGTGSFPVHSPAPGNGEAADAVEEGNGIGRNKESEIEGVLLPEAKDNLSSLRRRSALKT